LGNEDAFEKNTHTDPCPIPEAVGSLELRKDWHLQVELFEASDKFIKKRKTNVMKASRMLKSSKGSD
jgi:hypothetical protein